MEGSKWKERGWGERFKGNGMRERKRDETERKMNGT